MFLKKLTDNLVCQPGAQTQNIQIFQGKVNVLWENTGNSHMILVAGHKSSYLVVAKGNVECSVKRF